MAQIDDHMAAASLGCYPDPDDNPTGAQRAAYFASQGLLGTLPAAAEVTPESYGLRFLGQNLSDN